MKPGLALLALMVLAPAAPALGQARIVPAAGAPISEAQRSKATQLATLMNPPARMLEHNMIGWEAAITRTLALDPTIAKLETEYPGTTKAGVEAARPLARGYCEDGVRRSIEAKAAAYARRMSASELDQAIAFFRSPTGQRYLDGLFVNTDVVGLAHDIATERSETGTGRISTEQVATGDRQAVRKTKEALSAGDNLELMRFAQTSASQQLQAASAEADRVILEIVNNPDPKWAEGQNRAVSEAIIAFVDARRRGK